jgi:hypothetical protein
MGNILFKASVLKCNVELTEKGYEATSVKRGKVHFQKELSTGVICRIDFSLDWPSSTHHSFSVGLRRLRFPTCLAPEDQYKTLFSSLESLMLSEYSIDISEGDDIYWTYTDRAGLDSELELAKKYLISYGIGWLEDPISTQGR